MKERGRGREDNMREKYNLVCQWLTTITGRFVLIITLELILSESFLNIHVHVNFRVIGTKRKFLKH